MIVASYIMRCRGMSSAVTPSDNFTPNDRFSVSLPRKFIFTACMISKQVIIQQMRTKSTDAKARPQNYTKKLLMKSESHYRIKERPTKIVGGATVSEMRLKNLLCSETSRFIL